MDLVSQLIESNTQRAIAINQSLVRNESQINNIKKNQNEIIKNQNNISYLLDTIQGYWHRLWNSNDTEISNPPDKTYFSSKLDEKNNKNKDNKNNYNIRLEENIYLDQLAPLRELANNMSRQLDEQNTILKELDDNQEQIELDLLKNQNKINKILEK